MLFDFLERERRKIKQNSRNIHTRTYDDVQRTSRGESHVYDKLRFFSICYCNLYMHKYRSKMTKVEE